MPSDPKKLLMGVYFYPRGGSAHVNRALAREFARNGFEVTVLAGSRSDLGEHAEASRFYSGLDLRPVDFTPALRSADPPRVDRGPGTAPMHGSYEDRPGAEDPVLACLDDEAYERQVEAWTRELERAGAAEADLLYLHHLTPLNEAAARAFPALPVIGHVHGTELLMLERIAADAPPSWAHAEEWRRRLCGWAAACDRIAVADAGGLERAATVLDLEPERFVAVPNGFDPTFAPGPVDRAARWRRTLVERPQGWRPGEPAGSIAYREADLAALAGTVLISVGRFTEVKRLPLLIEAFGLAHRRFVGPAALILVGGHPGEWEGEHPVETIERLGVSDVFLAGWHSHDDLPDLLRASDVLVHASVHEQFGQVLVEAMACELPTIAVDRAGPAEIVDDPDTGWLVEPDDVRALAAAMVAAVNAPMERRLRGRRAHAEAVDRYAWETIGDDLAAVADDLLDELRGAELSLRPGP
jgi:glycosyltransferase involved in cell wall biosynthesis